VSKLAIIGAGSWGTALSIALSRRYESIALWTHEADLASRIETTRENDVYLPGFQLAPNIGPVTDFSSALENAEVVLGVMPSRFARSLYERMLPHVRPEMQFVSATKGIEQNTLLRMSEVITQVLGSRFEPKVAVLSGPTFAREIARGDPAAVVISSTDECLARNIQRAFSGPVLRLYTNTDPIGVELGAALKNVIAIAAGICQGLGLGSNTLAALITRGLAEITRLAVAAGGQPPTLAGLAGLGDLVLTCTGDLSRNRSVGFQLAKGRPLTEITASTKMIAEGVETTAAAVALSRRLAVDMPITRKMWSILSGETSPREAVKDLMERSLKHE
jgi:glycerol-3-phosphate dehydrogenase (NAD(P)+)